MRLVLRLPVPLGSLLAASLRRLHCACAVHLARAGSALPPVPSNFSYFTSRTFVTPPNFATMFRDTRAGARFRYLSGKLLKVFPPVSDVISTFCSRIKLRFPRAGLPKRSRLTSPEATPPGTDLRTNLAVWAIFLCVALFSSAGSALQLGPPATSTSGSASPDAARM